MTGISYVPAASAGLSGIGGRYVRDDSRFRGTNNTLDRLMECDHVIRVDEAGLVWDDVQSVYAPEFSAQVEDESQFTASTEPDMVREIERQGWSAASGWSSQYGSGGADVVMHTSEFVGGRMAEHIIGSPGYWVVCSVECDGPEGREEDPAGWVLLHLPGRVERVSDGMTGRVVSTMGYQVGVSWQDGTCTTESVTSRGESWDFA